MTVLLLLLALVAAGALTLAYAALFERNWFALRRHRVPCLPPGSEPVTLLHVSDLHFRSNLGAMRRFVRRLHEVRPDVVVGTGDFLGDTTSSADCARMLGKIPARHGGIFVLGSNDYYAPVRKSPLKYFRKPKRRGYRKGPDNDWTTLVDGLRSHGWRYLPNAVEHVAGMRVTGLDDPHIKRHDFAVADPSPGAFDLCVVHSPDVAPELARRGFDLILAGHTHGGQIRVPGYGALVTNTDHLPRRMARGLHRLDGAWLHVSAGMGTSKYAPIRFSCRPEACVLELVPRDATTPA